MELREQDKTKGTTENEPNDNAGRALDCGGNLPDAADHPARSSQKQSLVSHPAQQFAAAAGRLIAPAAGAELTKVPPDALRSDQQRAVTVSGRLRHYFGNGPHGNNI